MGLTNVLTVDVEDWFNVLNMAEHLPRERWPECESRVLRNTRRLLDLFERHGVEATFFVLGWTAEQTPGLVEEILAHGHEVASHGYSHTPLTRMTPDEFGRDLQRSVEVLRAAGAHDVAGYRAPSFTITRETLWAYDVLAECGFRYDSSVFPVGFHPDYGLADAPLEIHTTESGIIELPLSVAELAGRRIPCSGGGYFRLLPYSVSRALMRRCNAQGRPVIFYVHPWELDPDQPRQALPPLKRFRHYVNLGRTMGRLERLLAELPFTSIRRTLET